MTTNTTTTDDVATRRRTVRDIIARSGGTTADADTLIDADADMNTVKSKALDLMLARGNVSITTTRHNANTLDNPDALIRAAGEALYCRVDPAHKPEEASRQFIGLTIPELARELLRRQGVNTTGMSSDTVITRAMMSTSDFPLILSDTVNRTLRVAYSAAPSGIRQLGRQTTANDFRMKSRLMLDSSGLTLLPVLETGEYKYAALAEAGESYRLNTFGRIIPISRQALVNDDLSAFSDLTRRLGQAAASFESQTLVDLLEANGGLGPTMSDGQPLFDATHGNMAATGAALSLTTDVPLSDARLSMRKQVSPSGGLIAVTPRYLLVPSELETTGEKLLATIHATDVEQVSVWSKLTLVVEPRFKNATRWYVVADPAEIDGLEICYLAGGQGPQTESRAGFHVDGVEVKIREDFGCGFVETRGWYTNDGTP